MRHRLRPRLLLRTHLLHLSLLPGRCTPLLLWHRRIPLLLGLNVALLL
jgi:hypothetical protein